jgi:hypothetical protein|tara:strand:- start:465 stop:659 length:195 start_codon:yes stop_codon:yes gene_type:complete
MDKRTVASAHERIDIVEKDVVALSTQASIQFKEVFIRIKRLEAILIGTAGFIIALLLAVLTKMG